MSIQQNVNRIRTTHIGSLPRPRQLLDALKAKYAHEPAAEARFDQVLSRAVAECVRRQTECGIDIVTDGEFSKPGFFTYVAERLEGYEVRPITRSRAFRKEVAAFPEYYEQYFKEAMLGGAVVPAADLVCVSPVRYRGEELVQRDIPDRRASGVDRGAPVTPCEARRTRKCDGRRGLRFLLAGVLQERSPPYRRMGEVQGTAAGCGTRQPAVMALSSSGHGAQMSTCALSPCVLSRSRRTRTRIGRAG